MGVRREGGGEVNATLESMRVRTGVYGSNSEDGFNGMFEGVISYATSANMKCADRVRIIASDGCGWQHVSVSLIGKPHTTPRWQLMCAIKDLFWDAEDVVMQLHPKKSEYVNRHPGCLHLWRPTDQAIPTPPKYFVG